MKKGFTLVEILVTVAIIGVLAAVVAVPLNYARKKGRDTKRKADVAQIGRFLSASCYLPDAGAGDYDLADLLVELRAKNPQYAQAMALTPKDPGKGTASQSSYRYAVSTDRSCALYANLENEDEPVSLQITEPTPGGGTGVLRAPTDGWNGTPLYFQISN
jgi:prepilin-type N-terminal cleavage/methylation domain-containing protein